MDSAPASRQPRSWRVAWPALACAFAGVAVFQFFGNANRGYIDTASLFYWWGYQWINPGSETEHGWLILGLSAWLFWRNVRTRAPEPGAGSGEQERRPDFLAPSGALVAGLALHAVGFAAQQARLSILALLIFAWGVVRLAGGRRWGAAGLFPLAFMVFAIPINVLDSAGFWLRMWVLDASSGLAHLCGIGVLRSGTQLLAPDGRYNYDVAAACSGVRSLTAMAALSLLAGYLNFRGWWRRTLVLMLCFPLVYLGNVARISAIIFAAQMGGQAWGEHAHTVMGFGVFAIVLGGVLAAVSAMQRWWPEPGAGSLEPGAQSSQLGARSREPGGGSARLAFVALGVFALVAGEMIFLHTLANLPPRGGVGVLLADDGRNPAELPAFLGTEWVGRRTEVTPIEREVLPPDTGYSRKLYVPLHDPQKTVLLSIVLSGRDRTSIHRPEVCLVGQGWTIAGFATRTFRYPPGAGPAGREPGTFPAAVLQVKREVPAPRGPVVVPQLVAYWFVGADDIVATHWQRLARDAWNRVVHARADRWAYVLMQTDASDGEAAALARMQAVLDGTLPFFQRPAEKGGDGKKT